MRFVSELQRRNVIKVCVLYVVAGWLLLRLAGLATLALAAPAWVMKAFFIILLIGFPVAVIFSWVYEITPHGLKLETDVKPGQSIAHQTGKRIDRLIIFVVLAAIVMLLIDRFMT
jgi:hypothetical protein